MKVLWLGPPHKKLDEYLRAQRDEAVFIETPLEPGSALLGRAGFIVSYGYRHRVAKEIVDRYRGRAVNLHISLLPWNRGADPNLWSFLEETPKGVTIHALEEKIDAGGILFQSEVHFDGPETLRSSYDKLSHEIESLFIRHWPDIRDGRARALPQPAGGSSHTSADRRAVEHLLRSGWDTPVKELAGMGRKHV